MSVLDNADLEADYALLRKLRDGAPWSDVSAFDRLLKENDSVHRITLFAQTFRDIFQTGTRRSGMATIGGLRADELHTAQRGAIVFVENPSAGTVTGSVIPYIPEITLSKMGIFPYVHDAPIGATDKYLNAYAGLVKSDAFVLAAHVRPDPYEGVRVYVYGEPGESKEVVLFNGQDKGRATMVTFTSEPRVYENGVSQIVALSLIMAATANISLEPEKRNEPVMLVELRAPNDTNVHFLHADGSLRSGL